MTDEQACWFNDPGSCSEVVGLCVAARKKHSSVVLSGRPLAYALRRCLVSPAAAAAAS